MKLIMKDVAGEQVAKNIGTLTATEVSYDGLPVVLELLQQPGLELVGVIHRQLGHEVESALGALAHHAGDLR